MQTACANCFPKPLPRAAWTVKGCIAFIGPPPRPQTTSGMPVGSSGSGENAGSGLRVKVQRCGRAGGGLPAPPPSLWLVFLTPRRSVSVFYSSVAARCGNHLMVIDLSPARTFPNGRAGTPQLIRMNDLRNLRIHSETGSGSVVRRPCPGAAKEVDPAQTRV
jgi:hypothetical protein